MRFSEFDVYWTTYKLEACAKIYDGTHQTPKYTKSGIRFISVENISNLYDSQKFISLEDFKKEFKIHPQINDILMTRIGDIGTPAVVSKEDPLAYYVSLALIRPLKNLYYLYIYDYIQTPYFKKELWHRTLHIAFPQKINKEEIGKCKISIPCEKEQFKIGNFLLLIDQRINTQSKIIEDLESFKNMISYKILYDDKTACYKPLSSFSELKNGYAFKSTTYSSKGDYQIVTIANVSGDRYIDLTSSNKILNIPNDIQSHQILKINDILISLTGNVGRVSYCNKLNCLLNQRVGLLSIKNKDLIEYIFQCIHNKIFEKTMISRGQGVAQLNIGKNDVESFEIPVYSQDRMNSISEVLKSIDYKIIKEKDILELYKKQKAYLLKNMFI